MDCEATINLEEPEAKDLEGSAQSPSVAIYVLKPPHLDGYQSLRTAIDVTSCRYSTTSTCVIGTIAIQALATAMHATLDYRA
jgi:hypothetical protein